MLCPTNDPKSRVSNGPGSVYKDVGFGSRKSNRTERKRQRNSPTGRLSSSWWRSQAADKARDIAYRSWMPFAGIAVYILTLDSILWCYSPVLVGRVDVKLRER
jgi:hypothetical protein